MGSQSVSFIASLYFWLMAFLVIGVIISAAILKGRKSLKNNKPKRARKEKNKVFSRKKKGGGGSFNEKLGEKIVNSMIDISRSIDRTLIMESIAIIKQECERLNSLVLPPENKRIISQVLIWAKRFNIEKHLSEMAILQRSNQISYDEKKKDFHLMITED